MQGGERQTINIDELTQLAYRTADPSPAPSARGKRVASASGASGGSGKKSRTDSTNEAIHWLDNLRVASMESCARREEQERARGAKACMELVVVDGFIPGTSVWL
ncbi:hypothetical protein E2562_038134 [Oryza meyeriana var. granulata]|uniref:Uncharacterized protein n=1 Tax=Oryza meyeriana var. granulata TaxID=110450 RepID=A0A6G1DTG1_9ORYZ|nr:hypothetical protein E2562_038134 [Oryza meyeriana var. granulata]